MVENPLAFDFSKTRTICVAFDEAWAFLQGLGSDLTEASNSLATQTILAKRIIEMADQGLRDIPELRDDALAFLQHSPPSASRNGLGEANGAQTASLAERQPVRTTSTKPHRPSREATKVGWDYHGESARQAASASTFRPLARSMLPRLNGGAASRR